jgi:hypothetical protein
LNDVASSTFSTVMQQGKRKKTIQHESSLAPSAKSCSEQYGALVLSVSDYIIRSLLQWASQRCGALTHLSFT